MSLKKTHIFHLDCTLRDGGYYNNWEFNEELVQAYLFAMAEAKVDYVELGLRSKNNNTYKGAWAYTTDTYLSRFDIAPTLGVGVMVNGVELVGNGVVMEEVLQELFPNDATHSRVDLVRIACHAHEFKAALHAVPWLKARGFKVGFNLMQIAEYSEQQILDLIAEAAKFDFDALYFADSMGSMLPSDAVNYVQLFATYWKGAIGIHTHDNMGYALQNTLKSIESGVRWIDSTVTGMGRGPGNAKTEELVLALGAFEKNDVNLVPLMQLVERSFIPMQKEYGWGKNAFYFLSGKYGIHPTYIQSMIADQRFNESDILSVIDYLRDKESSKYSASTLEQARNSFQGVAKGNWNAAESISNESILILGSGPKLINYSRELKEFVQKKKPYVISLNAEKKIDDSLIHTRSACNFMRLLADVNKHLKHNQPLITPFSNLSQDLQITLGSKTIFDFGMQVKPGHFEITETSCVVPNNLVISYTLAIAAASKVNTIYLAGFEGYTADDPRRKEMDQVFELFTTQFGHIHIYSITPTKYNIESRSIYAYL